ncbi:MAG: HAMP domain-containing sensor histidine kinase [Thermoflexaceae bacterium]|nr:HAMP domain-containing sensor histidine kinase [Thermoflexaceae bacterium]
MYIQSGVWVIISRHDYDSGAAGSGFINTVNHFINSIRFRIMAAIIIMGILPMLVMEHGVITTFRQSVIKNKVIDIQSQLNQIARKIGSGNSFIDEKTNVCKEDITLLSDVFNGRILVVNSQMRIIYDTYVFEEGKTLISEMVINGLSGNGDREIINDGEIIEISVPICYGNDQIIGLLLADVNEGEFLVTLEETSSELYVIRILLMLAIIVIAVVFSGLLVEPIEAITRSIRRFSQGYNEHVTESGYSEIAELSGEFNNLFGRMSKLDESRQEFVSNVSHELKTPITSIKVLADSLNGQEDVPVELYREFMEDIVKEIDRENKIINDLLTLVRLDKTAAALNINSVNINELIESVLKRLSPLASRENIEITYESFRNVTADVDEVKLSLAITNLVENAIKYNKKDGWIKVSLNADHKFFYVQVEDSGIGIPKDQQDKVFERFYRVDKTRSRETGGTGLGLAITRDAVIMHNGLIKLESRENEGSRFIIRIPLNYSGTGR